MQYLGHPNAKIIFCLSEIKIKLSILYFNSWPQLNKNLLTLG